MKGKFASDRTCGCIRADKVSLEMTLVGSSWKLRFHISNPRNSDSVTRGWDQGSAALQVPRMSLKFVLSGTLLEEPHPP